MAAGRRPRFLPLEPLRGLEFPYHMAAERSKTEQAGSRSAFYDPASEAAHNHSCSF